MTPTKNYQSTLISVLLAIFIFLVPSNLFYTFYQNTAYVHGIRSDYLIPKIYLSDIAMLSVLVSAFWLFFLSDIPILKKKISSRFNSILRKKTDQNIHKMASVYQLASIISVTMVGGYQFISGNYITRLLILKLLIMSAFIAFFYIKRDIIIDKYIKISINITLAFQSILALYQFFFQKSLVGYYFLGEPNLLAYAGIAKSQLLGGEKILSYGTTAHPNILGGMLVAYLYLLMRQKYSSFRKKMSFSIIEWGVILLSFSALYTTQSLSAGLSALIMGGVWYLRSVNTKNTLKNVISHTLSSKTVTVPLVVLFVSTPIIISILAQQFPNLSTSFTRRDYLNVAGVKMFLSHPMLGVGYGNFTRTVEQYANHSEIVRFVQPAHHLGIVFLAEWGVLGLICLLAVSRTVWPSITSRQQDLLALACILLPLVTLDHYLYTLQSGRLLLGLMLMLSTERKIVT